MYILSALSKLRQGYAVTQFHLAPFDCGPYRHSNSGVGLAEFQAHAFSHGSHGVFGGGIEVQWAIWVHSVSQRAVEKLLSCSVRVCHVLQTSHATHLLPKYQRSTQYIMMLSFIRIGTHATLRFRIMHRLIFYGKLTFFFHGATAPGEPRRSHYRGFTITLRHTTLGRTPLDE